MSWVWEAWHWLIYAPAGQTVRIAAGVGVLFALAAVDLFRRGRAATRWREYAFLVCTVVVALLYGVINDQITSRISWEYFYYGKDLSKILGPEIPPEAAKLSWEAAKVGMKATWAVGLLVGVACLLANNPRAGRRRITYARLLVCTLWVVVVACAFAAIFGYVGYRGGFASLSEDFRDMLRENLFRPHRFMAVYGIHLGGYVGGGIGAIVAVASILRARKRVNSPSPYKDSA